MFFAYIVISGYVNWNATTFSLFTTSAAVYAEQYPPVEENWDLQGLIAR